MRPSVIRCHDAGPGALQIERFGLAVTEEDVLGNRCLWKASGHRPVKGYWSRRVPASPRVCRCLSLTLLVHRSSLDMIKEIDVVLGPSHSPTVRACVQRAVRSLWGQHKRHTHKELSDTSP